jgi:hypothetical protein
VKRTVGFSVEKENFCSFIIHGISSSSSEKSSANSNPVVRQAAQAAVFMQQSPAAFILS